MFKFLTSWFGPKRPQALPWPTSGTPATTTTPDINTATTVNADSADDVVPYDENLLERARTQWQFGDWASLAQLARDTLQHHPDRARLALLAAAGHQHMGNHQAARQFVRLAQDWGCSKALIARVLISGVYDTLGRAAVVSGHEQLAQRHFQQAVTVGSPGNDVRLLSENRHKQTLAELGLPEYSQTTRMQVRLTTVVTPSTESNTQLPPPQARSIPEPAVSTDESPAPSPAPAPPAAAVNDIKQQLSHQIRQEILNATKQLEAFLAVQAYFNTGELMPAMHGWPISPDFALYLIELLEANDYDAVIEFGSGSSTVLVAKTLAHLASQRSAAAGKQIAFEHLQQYHKQTTAGLKQAELVDAVELVLAPLQPYTAPDGTSYSYYSCDDALAAASQQLAQAGPKILVLVDGPPGSTGKNARYPALPLILKHFAHAHLDILLDDYIRQDEKETAKLWVRDLDALARSHTFVEKKLEKDAAFFNIPPIQA